MKKAKCEGGHFFDMDRFSVCPICQRPGAGLADAPAPGRAADSVAKTELLWQQGKNAVPKTMLLTPTQEDPEPKTTPLTPSENEPEGLPGAWLVEVSRPGLGQTFSCGTGRTRVGRGTRMDIRLPEAVSPEALQASIIYEPVRREFSLQAEIGAELISLNGVLVRSRETLRPYDRIRLGNVEFVFLPLCGARFSWREQLEREGRKL